jgi:hypothetical protein
MPGTPKIAWRFVKVPSHRERCIAPAGFRRILGWNRGGGGPNGSHLLPWKPYDRPGHHGRAHRVKVRSLVLAAAQKQKRENADYPVHAMKYASATKVTSTTPQPAALARALGSILAPKPTHNLRSSCRRSQIPWGSRSAAGVLASGARMWRRPVCRQSAVRVDGHKAWDDRGKLADR